MPNMLDATMSEAHLDTGPRAAGLGLGPHLATEETSPRFARQESFEREALPHLRQLYTTAYRLTRNVADAEDLVQETYLRAFRAFERYRLGTNVRAWLTTILYRARTDSFRKASRSPRTVELVDDGPACSPPQEALSGGQEDIARALAALPEAFRTALLMRDVQDFSYDEIAKILGIPIGTVMSRIHRGRTLLRGALGNLRRQKE
jgi:RNA polymerase sigma-70 factor, ECF subfamily